MSKRIKLRRSQNHNTWGKLLQSYSKRTDPEAKKFFAALISEAFKKQYFEESIRWTVSCSWCSIHLPAILTLKNLPPAIFEIDNNSSGPAIFSMLRDGTIIIPRETNLIALETLILTSKVKATLSKRSSFPRAKNV